MVRTSSQPPSPAGEQGAERTRVARQEPVAVSQTRASPSYELDTISEPSPLKSTAVTGSECAGRSCRAQRVIQQVRAAHSTVPHR